MAGCGTRATCPMGAVASSGPARSVARPAHGRWRRHMRGWPPTAIVVALAPRTLGAQGLERISNAAEVGAVCAEVAAETPALRAEAAARLRRASFGSASF